MIDEEVPAAANLICLVNPTTATTVNIANSTGSTHVSNQPKVGSKWRTPPLWSTAHQIMSYDNKAARPNTEASKFIDFHTLH